MPLPYLYPDTALPSLLIYLRNHFVLTNTTLLNFFSSLLVCYAINCPADTVSDCAGTQCRPSSQSIMYVVW